MPATTPIVAIIKRVHRVVGTFTDENNQLSCSPHKICGTGESYIFYGVYQIVYASL